MVDEPTEEDRAHVTELLSEVRGFAKQELAADACRVEFEEGAVRARALATGAS
ncbi:MAG: hypothetical protein K8H88_04035 [Sandaracinaceae bacterium]|nr:hypothetical protein [Sandaracinaceae bacterium]